jgi:4-hydroxy-tetrahydrodipicolinate synthase
MATEERDEDRVIGRGSVYHKWSGTTIKRRRRFMTKSMHLKGYIAGPLVPFKDTLEINEKEYETQLEVMVKSHGLCGVYVNALVGEVYALEPEERQRLIALARQITPKRVPIIAGITGTRMSEIEQRSKEAEKAGADVLMINPPFEVRTYRRLAGKDDPPYRFFKEFTENVNMPTMVFKYPREYGLSYSNETLVRIADDFDQVIGIKAGNYNSSDYYRMWNALKGKISVFATGGDTVDLLGMMMIGADGAEAGIMCIGEEHWARFISLSLDGSYAEARNIFMEKLAPIADYIYGLAYLNPMAPFSSGGRVGSTTAMIKDALVTMGVFSNSRVRPPDLDTTPEERKGVVSLLKNLGLIEQTKTV